MLELSRRYNEFILFFPQSLFSPKRIYNYNLKWAFLGSCHKLAIPNCIAAIVFQGIIHRPVFTQLLLFAIYNKTLRRLDSVSVFM
jgi:hypothetical protein